MKIFDTTTALAAATLTAGQMVSVKEVGSYRIKASGSGITLANGNVAEPVASGTAVNVKQFGAVGDGVADDTAAIQAAIDSLPIRGSVHFPYGSYNISSTITINERITLIGSTASGRGSKKARIVWVGANSGTLFDVGAGSTALGTTFHGLNLSTSATSTILIDGTGTYNMVVEQCEFTTTTYSTAIKVSETGAGSDGAYWARIRENIFTNCYVNVLSDSNATFINDNDFYADLTDLSGPSLVVDGGAGINAVMIDGNTFEGTYLASTYAVSITGVIQFTFSNNRVENVTGGSLYLGVNHNNGTLIGNFLNSPYVVGGSRASTLHNSGQSYTDIGNRLGSDSTIRTAEIGKLGSVIAGENVLKNGPINLDWFFNNCSNALIQDGSAGLRCPIIRLHTPTAGTASGQPTQVLRDNPQIQLAIQNEDFVTAVFIVKAKSTNVANSVVLLDTGDTQEYWNVPKDDKWHVIKVPRRLKTTDTTLTPTAYLAYASSTNAADELWIGGMGLYLGTGATELPFFDGWSTDPATAGSTSYFQRGDIARNVYATTGSPAGWMCTAKGNPGTWKPLANLA